MFGKHGIRDCSILLHRLSPSPTSKKKKFVETSSQKLSVRFNVPWLPTISKTVGNPTTGYVAARKKPNEVFSMPTPSMLRLQKSK